jgi:hypothetical protein
MRLASHHSHKDLHDARCEDNSTVGIELFHAGGNIIDITMAGWQLKYRRCALLACLGACERA